MHALSYRLKRAHLSAVAAGRHILKQVQDMTPARFDILYVIYTIPRELGPFRRCVDQAELWRRLGLSRATVSKMVKRLEELGLVTRERFDSDRRRMLVILTDEGIWRLRQALHVVFNGKPLIRAYQSLLGPRRWSSRTRWHLQHFLARLRDTLYDIAKMFEDSSEPVYRLNYIIDH